MRKFEDEVIEELRSLAEENAGMLEALVTAGIVRPTGSRVKSGFVELHVVVVLRAGEARS